MINKWSKYDILWLIFSVMLILGAVIYKCMYVPGSNNVLAWISNVSAIMGVIYVFGIAKQTKFAYFFGIVNVILYSIVCYKNGWYISSIYNLFYSFPIMLYGYIYWGKVKGNEHGGIKVLSTKKRIILSILMIFAVFVCTFISGVILSGENVLLDSLVSVCVCVATFLMARKYIEQWVLFIVANFAGVVMFIAVNYGNMNNIELLMMWVIYLINSVYGLYAWKKELNKVD